MVIGDCSYDAPTFGSLHCKIRETGCDRTGHGDSGQPRGFEVMLRAERRLLAIAMLSAAVNPQRHLLGM
jgi:hypothetical protein